MKKSEFIQLTQIVEHLVVREIKKQLPTLIAETFQNMMGKPQQTIVEQKQEIYVESEVDQPIEEEVSDLKLSLRELFAGTPVMKKLPENPNGPRPMKHFTKDPKLNAVLNETVSNLRSKEGLMSMAAFQGGYDPSGAGTVPPMMEAPAFENEPSFMKNTPSIPISRPPVLVEGQESNHAPLAEALPDGVSALDIARQFPLAAPVAQALTKNYSQMMKLIDQKKGKR